MAEAGRPLVRSRSPALLVTVCLPRSPCSAFPSATTVAPRGRAVSSCSADTTGGRNADVRCFTLDSLFSAVTRTAAPPFSVTRPSLIPGRSARPCPNRARRSPLSRVYRSEAIVVSQAAACSVWYPPARTNPLIGCDLAVVVCLLCVCCAQCWVQRQSRPRRPRAHHDSRRRRRRKTGQFAFIWRLMTLLCRLRAAACTIQSLACGESSPTCPARAQARWCSAGTVACS